MEGENSICARLKAETLGAAGKIPPGRLSRRGAVCFKSDESGLGVVHFQDNWVKTPRKLCNPVKGFNFQTNLFYLCRTLVADEHYAARITPLLEGVERIDRPCAFRFMRSSISKKNLEAAAHIFKLYSNFEYR